ncbi:hypothetical protein [Salsipaludibacter albus]|uniref:hypothetical protein n=1 Tax=Salsipaludibacter albus TaxID=2849650 RepID=UPI001EE3DD46|nr:hypothetical protein [Salsipaludibacter albus]MBY5161366.1 hypothetical protein [Salsipaludibacter albus]
MSILPGLRQALVEWMLVRRDRPAMHVAVPWPAYDGDAESSAVECWSVGEVLYALWDDPQPAPDSVTALLKLPAGVTIGQVARLLYAVRADRPSSTYGEVVERLARLPRSQVARLLDGVVDTFHDRCQATTVSTRTTDSTNVALRR